MRLKGRMGDGRRLHGDAWLAASSGTHKSPRLSLLKRYVWLAGKTCGSAGRNGDNKNRKAPTEAGAKFSLRLIALL
jgi:hypothetical protein